MHPDHRTLRWLVLFGYVLVAAGVPLPAGSMAAGASRNSAAAKRLAGKDRSVPFPCMDSPCGCVTAEQCFESCCCHTPAELLAWATARNLSLDVLQGLERRLEQAPPAVGGSCCGEATPEPVSCCEAAAACCDEVAPSCCDQVASCCDDAVVTAAAADACWRPRSAGRGRGHSAVGVGGRAAGDARLWWRCLGVAGLCGGSLACGARRQPA